MNNNRCITCEKIIPEGRQVCPNYENKKIKDKEIIKEMAKDIYHNSHFTKGISDQIAKFNVRNGYRKLPKDSVVLSMEEYESLYTQEQYDKVYEQAENDILANIADGGTSCHWCIEEHEKMGYEKGSKEMAEKILREFAVAFPKAKGISSSHVKINKFIDELTKQCNIEIKEN